MFRPLLLPASCLVLAFVVIGASQVRAASPTPDANVAAGKRLFLRCGSCHAIGANAAARIGPNLQGVVGRKAGSLSGYKYSPAMAGTNFTWTPDKLDLWLTKPTALVPGTAMAFAGLPNPQDRQALIAYLAQAGN